jgi:hypothetical protein
MDATTLELVRRRAEERCEYCRIPQASVVARFHVEHIIAKQHGGNDDPSNLALACDRCNAFKGPNLSGIDPSTGNIVTLFHPRRDLWLAHFSVENGLITGLSDMGRATARLLNMNAYHRIQLRFEIESDERRS